MYYITAKCTCQDVCQVFLSIHRIQTNRPSESLDEYGSFASKHEETTNRQNGTSESLVTFLYRVSYNKKGTVIYLAGGEGTASPLQGSKAITVKLYCQLKKPYQKSKYCCRVDV